MLQKIAKRYRYFLIMLAATLLITLFNNQIGLFVFQSAGDNFKQMLSLVPPIMILLGLMDVWIPRERMMKYMGKDSGVTGVFLAILIGSLAAGPMYAAFPFTAVLIKKGVKLSNIIIFMNAWCVTKIPTLLFEIGALGYKFTFSRFIINLPGIIIMGYLVEWLMGKEELDALYENVVE